MLSLSSTHACVGSRVGTSARSLSNLSGKYALATASNEAQCVAHVCAENTTSTPIRFSSCAPSLWQSVHLRIMKKNQLLRHHAVCTSHTTYTHSAVQRTSFRKHWQYCFKHFVRLPRCKRLSAESLDCVCVCVFAVSKDGAQAQGRKPETMA